MGPRITKIITVAVAILAVAAPIKLAIYLAAKEARDTETNSALDYAKDALARSDSTTDQITRGVASLMALQSVDPCSDASVELMRKIDLASSYIQSIGYMRGNQLVCSSLGLEGKGLNLGPVDWTQRDGAKIRANVQLPFAKGISFIVVETQHYAAIIHKDLPLDIRADAKGLALAAISSSNGQVFTSKGYIKPSWFDALAGKSETAFIDGDHVVAVVASQRYEIASIAALPIAHLAQRTRTVASLIILGGVLVGIALSIVVLYRARQRMAMPTILKTALRRGEFFMVYQPIVDLQTNQWVGAEALIRWRRPDGQMVRPDIFIPVAEDAGLIRQVTQHVVGLIANDAADLFKRRPDFHIGINLSAEDLHADETVGMLNGLKIATGAGAGNLLVEITERGFADPEKAREIVRQLRSIGMPVAIDDFGTGYSSLSYLESFEIDYLKIDKSFVDTIGTDAATSHVVQHIVEMARSLGLKMIAEGVETSVQAEFLRSRGVQYAQGWLFSKPMSLPDLLSASGKQ
ncbi:cyclic diguanylate phosphodiesterase [Stenotrophobium rhamnosiphilum]|uniref:cyclic-guanylate-specific phosphodiesterase n=1 Tax=Stenotrophobium rhamnosiphilum TaxID=2029166 RepID=A0A2T5MD56_9GAMM|nr:cyclic diguanylate phosphodiesterase [Stenotrophobium rhamnosiphilum]